MSRLRTRVPLAIRRQAAVARRVVPAVVLFGAIAGCAVGPDYKRPALDLPGAYPDSGATADSGGSAGSDASSAPPIATSRIPANWWSLFGDRRLDELVDAAVARNTNLALAAAQVDEAAGALREARAAQWPLLGGYASGSRGRSSQEAALFPQTVGPIFNDFKFGLSASFEVDLWGRLRRASEAARARLLATQYARDVVALSLATTTVEAYVTLRALDQQLELTRSNVARYDDTLAIVRRRVAGGYASSLDQSQFESARASESAQLQEIARQRSIVEHQLGQLTGRLDLRLDAGDLAALPLPPLPPPDVPSTLLERRPDVRQAEASLAAASALIGVARAAQFPTLSLTAAAGQESDALRNILDRPGSVWSLGAGLVGPILDAGLYAARTQQAEARQKEAAIAWRGSVETAFREVADALSNVRLASAADGDLKSAVDAAHESERVARSRYENGYAGYFELLDAQRTVNVAQIAYVRNREAQLGFAAELMRALGGGWAAP